MKGSSNSRWVDVVTIKILNSWTEMRQQTVRQIKLWKRTINLWKRIIFHKLIVRSHSLIDIPMHRIIPTDLSFVETNYRIHLKYWDPCNPYHPCPKIWTSAFYYQMTCLQTAEWMAKSKESARVWWRMTVSWGMSVLLFCIIMVIQSTQWLFEDKI